MRTLVVATLLFVAPASAFAASGEAAVIAPVRQLFDAFNKGDATIAAAGCTQVTAIIDDFPPYQWQGTGACSDWMQSYRRFADENGISDMVITLSAPRHVDVTVDVAYVVVPVNYTLKKHGKPVSKSNCIVTAVLRKGASGWVITAWAWADS